MAIRHESIPYVATTALIVLLTAAQTAAQMQDDRPCVFLCAPELKIEPTFTIEHLAQRHRVATEGAIARVGRDTTFELIFALDVPITIPRIGGDIVGDDLYLDNASPWSLSFVFVLGSRR